MTSAANVAPRGRAQHRPTDKGASNMANVLKRRFRLPFNRVRALMQRGKHGVLAGGLPTAVFLRQVQGYRHRLCTFLPHTARIRTVLTDTSPHSQPHTCPQRRVLQDFDGDADFFVPHGSLSKWHALLTSLGYKKVESRRGSKAYFNTGPTTRGHARKVTSVRGA